MRLHDALNRFYYDQTLNELRLMNENTLYPNITYNSLLYLDLIAYREDCTASYLAKALNISKSAVTIKVNELIRQGLVVKTRSEADRRVYYLHVSPEVEEDYRRYDRRLDNAVRAVTQRYGDDEVEQLCDMLDLIRKRYAEDPG
jgi:Transcriptional regulators